MQDNIHKWNEDIDNYSARLGQPLREAANQSDKDALEIVKLLIQSLILLHGGALVALPTLFQRVDHNTLGDLLFWLTVGLLSALCAGLFAFFALNARYQAYLSLQKAAQHIAHARAAQVRSIILNKATFMEVQITHTEAAAGLEEDSKLPFQRFNVFRGIGVALIFASVGALIKASYLAATNI